MNTLLKHYKASFITLILGLIFGGVVGYFESGAGGIATAVLSVAILCVLEISLSFDNAVLNASKLKDMNDKWKQWFVRWGMLISVFGMRLVLPILIVSVLGEISPYEAVKMGLTDPKQYSEVLSSSHHIIASFGGAFLLMVALGFYLEEDKDTHWIKWIEEPLSNLGKFGIIGQSITTLLIIFGISFSTEGHEQLMFNISGVCGVVLFLAIHFLQEYLEGRDEKLASVAGTVVRSGIAGVLYLEILDASLSFDGLIAAFAISDMFLVIMLGLGIGAFFVRSMTLHLLDSGHLAELRYLEHGAFSAIFILAALMLANFVVDVPEWVTGLLGVVLLGIAVLHSLYLNKKELEVLTS